MSKKEEVIKALKDRKLDTIAIHKYINSIKIEDFEAHSIEYFTSISNRLLFLEERLKIKLPCDYKNFIISLNTFYAGSGEWFQPEQISFAKDFDIVEFAIIEENPTLLSKKDCKYLIPLAYDNGAYIVMDTRDNGKGVFIIWSDEEELGFQSRNFEEFKSKIEERLKKEEYFEFDFFRTNNK